MRVWFIPTGLTTRAAEVLSEVGGNIKWIAEEGDMCFTCDLKTGCRDWDYNSLCLSKPHYVLPEKKIHQHRNTAALRIYTKRCIPKMDPGKLCEVLPISSFSTKKVPHTAGSAANNTLGIVSKEGSWAPLGAAGIQVQIDVGI